MGNDIFEWLMECIMPWFVILVITVMVIAIPFVGYLWWAQSHSPTFTLTKTEWTCTQRQTIPVTTYVMSGKIMVPITTYIDECRQWSKTP